MPSFSLLFSHDRIEILKQHSTNPITLRMLKTNIGKLIVSWIRIIFLAIYCVTLGHRCPLLTFSQLLGIDLFLHGITIVYTEASLSDSILCFLKRIRSFLRRCCLRLPLIHLLLLSLVHSEDNDFIVSSCFALHSISSPFVLIMPWLTPHVYLFDWNESWPTLIACILGSFGSQPLKG